MKHCITLIIAGLIALPTILLAQNTFQATYDLAQDDEFISVNQTADGGVITGGYSTGGPYGGIVSRFDFAGNVTWSKTVGGTKITEVMETSSGMIYAAGENNVSGYTNFYLVKLTSAGTVVWARTFGKTNDPDQLNAMDVTSDGGCILAGTGDSITGAGLLPTGYVVKVDSSGNMQWSKYISGGNGEEFYCVKEIFSGGFLACGYTGSYGSPVGTESYMVRFNASGSVMWYNVFGHNNRFDRIYDFVEKPNGGFWVTGKALYTSTTDNLFIASTDNNGNLNWHHNYNMYDGATSIMYLSDGNLAVCGYNVDQNLGIYNNSYLIKTDTVGSVIWARQYGTAVADDKIWCGMQTSDGGFLLSGSTYGTATMRTSWLVRADNTGTSGCRDSVLSIMMTTLTIASTSGGNASVVTYASNSTAGQLNAGFSVLFFCDAPTGIANEQEEDIRLFPQPAGSTLNIETGNADYTRYEMYNCNGQLVRAETITTSRLLIETASLASGIYFIRLVGETTEWNGKFVRE